MKHVVSIEVWLEVEASDQEEACKRGMELLGNGIEEMKKHGADWMLLEPDKNVEVVGPLAE